MSPLQYITNLLFEKAESPATETKAIVGSDAIGRTRPLNYTILDNAVVNFTSKNDPQLNIVYGSILNAIQTAARSIPWNAYTLKNDENAQKVPNHPLGNLLYRPNPRQSWGDFVAQYLSNYFGTGNAFIYGITGADSLKTVELYVMPPSTEVLTTGSGWLASVTGYRVPTQSGEYDYFEEGEVLHLKKYNPFDNFRGLSPLKIGILAREGIDTAMRQRIQQLANGGPKTVFFNASDDVAGLGEEQERNTVDKITRSNKPVFIDYKIGTAQIGLSPVDLDLLNSLQADAGMMADLLNYPSILLSGSKSTTYNNITEAQKSRYNDCIIPHLVELRDGLNFKFGKAYNDKVYMDMDLSNIEVLKPNLSALIAAATSADFLTINEKRKMAGYTSIEGGDGFLRSAAVEYLAKVDEVSATPADAYDDQDTEVTGE